MNFRLFVTTFLGVVFHVQALGSAMDSIRLEKQEGQYFVIHEVEDGETLYNLSRRYASTVDGIRNNNELRNGGIDLGQIIMIPIEAPEIEDGNAKEETGFEIDTRRKTHVVMPGETVYNLSKRYDLQFSELRLWNGLVDNNLSIGQTLYVSPPIEGEEIIQNLTDDTVTVEDSSIQEVEVDTENYHTHYVQSGETLMELARRFETIPDSLMVWNQLENTTLRIGDKILVKKTITLDSLNHSNPRTRVTSYGSKYWRVLTEKDTLIHEEGIAGTIENIIETQRFLALHRTLPVGAVMKVVNLMNHESLEVRVVGRLPETGLNRNLMIRFTDATFRKLGIIDRKSRVEIIYAEEKG